MTQPEKILEWREALTCLSDQHFFDLVRMYLGAVKTPFNKQRLIEELSAFLRKKENQKRIQVCLDSFDREVLAGIQALPSPTREKLVRLFSGSRTFPEVYERILNLEERLLVYRKGEQYNREYALNPLLEQFLEQDSAIQQLIRTQNSGEPFYAPFVVSDSVLAGMYSFFLHEGPAVRNDGSLKKKTLDRITVLFPELAADERLPVLVVTALRNLSLICVHDSVLVPDRKRWERFASCDTASRAAYLCASVYGRLTRESLQRNAQSFLDLVGFLQSGGRYSVEAVNRAAYLVSERAGSVKGGKGRFSRILQENNQGGDTFPSESLPDRAETALFFGLLADDGGYLVPNASLFGSGQADGVSLVVSPSFEAVLMPGTSLAEMLPLVSFMTVTSVQTVGNYEITRKSCASSFDQGETADSIIAILEKYSATPLPGNLLFTIKDWFSGYNALSLYHGYVLKVDDSRRILFENNENLSRLIRKTLAPGVYLLDTDSPEELQEAAALAGLDFLPSVGMGSPRSEAAPLPPLRAVVPHDSGSDSELTENSKQPRSSGAAERFRDELLQDLEGLSAPRDQKEALLSRIYRKIIISSGQLDPESVRPEKVEARGMDFLGKVRVAEQAAASGTLLEIHLEGTDGGRILLGRPRGMEKKRGDVVVTLESEADGSVEKISLGRAVLVRRIRGSIFSEPAH